MFRYCKTNAKIQMLKLLKCQEIINFKESKDSNPIVIETIQKIYDYSKEKYKKNKNKST